MDMQIMKQEFKSIGTRDGGLIMVYPPDNGKVTIVILDENHEHLAEAEFTLEPEGITVLIDALKGENE